MINASSIGQFWLVTLALVGGRDIFYNLLIRLQHFDFWKKLMVRWQAQKSYNPVFFAFAVQHVLANLAFLVSGIVCYLLKKGIITRTTGNDIFFNNLRALVFHTFLWDIVCWVRDHESFSRGFHKFYYPHHVLTLLLSIVWILAGVFELMPGYLGFFALTFLASSMTSDLGFFVYMFCDRKSKVYEQINTIMAYSPRIWRWSLIIWAIFEMASGREDVNVPHVTVLVSGFFMEAVMIYLHVQRFRNNRNTLQESKEDQSSFESDGNTKLDLSVSGLDLPGDNEFGEEAALEDISA